MMKWYINDIKVINSAEIEMFNSQAFMILKYILFTNNYLNLFK